MSRTRKEPRLNLRFADHDTLDELELTALQFGLSLPAWIKQVVFLEIKNHRVKSQTEGMELKSLLMLRGLAESKATEEEVEEAKSRIEVYLEKVNNNASTEY